MGYETGVTDAINKLFLLFLYYNRKIPELFEMDIFVIQKNNDNSRV